MLEWREAAPLIGVLVTAFLGYIGTLIAARRREAGTSAAAAVVPAAIGGAIAERGTAEALTLAIGQLTATILTIADKQARDRDEHSDDSKRRHREVAEELRRIANSLERRG